MQKKRIQKIAQTVTAASVFAPYWIDTLLPETALLMAATSESKLEPLVAGNRSNVTTILPDLSTKFCRRDASIPSVSR